MEDLNQSMNEETIPVEIPLTLQAIRLLKAYATLSGKPLEEVSGELGVAVSSIFEGKLKGMIADSIGVHTPTEVSMPKKLRPQRSYNDVVDEDLAYLGDAEDPEEIPPSTPVFSKGGLTDEDLDNDMRVDDPLHEAKAEPLAVDPNVSADDILANAIGANDTYVDERILKRKKRFSSSKGKVKPLSESVLAEGAGL